MASSPKFIIQALDAAKHRREDFDCGVPALNGYLQRNARKEMDASLAVCFVAVPEDDPGCIAGYYTLSAATIERADLPERSTRKLAKYSEFPATLLGRLATSLAYRGMGLGNWLMMSAFTRVVNGSEQVASWALITDPKDESARDFYKKFGFESLTPGRLYLPVQVIKKHLGSSAP